MRGIDIVGASRIGGVASLLKLYLGYEIVRAIADPWQPTSREEL